MNGNDLIAMIIKNNQNLLKQLSIQDKSKKDPLKEWKNHR